LDTVLGFNTYIAQYNPDGIPQWAKNFNGGVEINDIDAVDENKVYLTFNGFAGIQSGHNIITAIGSTEFMAVVLECTSSSIDVKDAIDYAGFLSYPFYAIAAQSNGRYSAGGYFTESAFAVAGVLLGNKGCFDGLILSEIDPINATQNIFPFGGGGCEAIFSVSYSNAMDMDKDGNLYFTGIFSQNGKIENITLPNNGIFLAKRKAILVSSKEPNLNKALIGVSPNPSLGNFILSLGSTPQNGQFMLCDITGKEMLRGKVVSQHQTIHIPVPNGVYILKYVDSECAGSVKIMVQQ
jgi:hypothetical protein